MKDSNKIDNKSKKNEYRAWAKDLRKNVDLKKASKQIQTKLSKLEVYRSAKTVMSYLPKETEISLEGLFQDVSKSWFLPVISESKSAESIILAAPFIFGKTKLTRNKFDILEPECNENNLFDQVGRKIKLDLIFVPGLCFDRGGNRIGFGAGYYDKFLKLNPDSFKIGCCPKECLVDELPIDPWDHKVDLVITP